MKKNVAGQCVIASLINLTDGSDVTASAGIFVTGDNGTRTAGAGTLTYKNGADWSYLPTQAETNYDHVAFTFYIAGVCSVTINLWPTFPQTGDSFARIGAPAGASASADIAALKAVDDAVKAKTDNLPSDPADESLIIAATDAIMGRLGAPAGASVSADIAAVLAKWTTAMTESYPALHTAPTPEQALFVLMSVLAEMIRSGTTVTANKLDGVTPAMTFTLDSATSPTAITRAS